MFDTSIFNTFNVLDRIIKVRVHNDIGPILSYSINNFQTAIFIFYQILSRPGIHVFYTTEIENDFAEIKSTLTSNSNCIIDLHPRIQMNFAF